MSSTVKGPLPTKVVTGVVRLSYLHIWEPSAVNEGDVKKYSASLIIPKSDKVTIEKVRAAIQAAKEAGKSKFGGKIPAKLKEPLRDGDEDRPEDEAYANSFFLNANASTKPGIVDKDVQPILDQNEVYSGCYAKVSVTFFAFDQKGNKGIGCGLNHIMKVKDGEPLGGRNTAESDFAEIAGMVEDDDDLM